MKTLDWLIILLGLLAVFLILTTPKSHCDACSFDLNSKTINFNKFMGIYQDSCFPKQYGFQQNLLLNNSIK